MTLEATVKRASELAYEQDSDMVVGRINSDWQVADSEDLGRADQMAWPKFTVRGDGLDAADVMGAMERAEIEGDQHWNDEMTVYEIDGETISVSGSVVEINQHA